MEKNNFKEKMIMYILSSVFVVACLVAMLAVPKILNAQSKPPVEPVSTLEPTQGAIAVITAQPLTPTPVQAAFVQTAVLVDGVQVGVLASREAAESVVEEIIEYYEGMIVVSGNNSIQTELLSEITYEDAPNESGIVTAEALAVLLTSADSPAKIKVQSVVTESVLTTVKHTYEIIKDKYLVEGTRIVESVGEDGQKQKTTVTIYENGMIKGSPEVTEELVKEEKKGIMRVGTQALDIEARPSNDEGKKGKDAGELSFAAPVSGRIIASFGQLDGVLHLGLDYSANSGAEVKASCSGKVVSVLERGGYGLTVEIDHGNGFLTRYAHLKEASVVIGKIVEQGEKIGIVGEKEDNSEGAALHFELRIDGEAYNPRYYLD
ncbi:MAG: peptidoglycan DD-metalloendopeptidase family protein [Clostridia bacterium]|nr:peptidoglycan DD-metalloendopeptidase family protein [Clostridia bacterium]